MRGDKSANQRLALDTRIRGVEQKEDELSHLRNLHQRSLERFHERFRSVSRRREAALHQSMQSGSSVAQRGLEEQEHLLAQVDRYVRDSAEELEQVTSRVRRSLDDERERLIRERNALPWE